MKRTDKKRLLLKLSGEALGDKEHLVSHSTLTNLASEISDVVKSDTQIVLVVGGGNILRGEQAATLGVERTTADYMGMLATVINGLYLASMVRACSIEARVMSTIAMPSICELYVRERALHHLQQGRVVIMGGGTGNPYFTTDSAAALRAIEMKCDVLLKATKVDGVYDKDPVIHKDAKRYDYLSYEEALDKNLDVMDAVAIALARENHLPIMVFNMKEKGMLNQLLQGKGLYTTIASSREA